jgi:hypothetical protein
MKLQYFLLISIFIFLGKQNLSAQGSGKWWLESSLSSKKQVDSLAGKSRKLLFHGEANYSYSRLDGITSGNVHSGKLLLVERFKPFSHFTSFHITAQNFVIKSSTVSAIKTENYTFHDYIDIDFNKVLFMEPGFIWERNVVSLLKSRHFIYFGIGANTVLFKKIKFKSLAAITRVDQDYIINVTYIDVVKEPYKAAYFNQEVSIQINKDIMLSTQVGYFLNLDDSERYLYKYNVDLKVKLLKNIGLVVGYSSNFNSDNAIFNLEQTNSTFNTGIQIVL